MNIEIRKIPKPLGIICSWAMACVLISCGGHSADTGSDLIPLALLGLNSVEHHQPVMEGGHRVRVDATTAHFAAGVTKKNVLIAEDRVGAAAGKSGEFISRVLGEGRPFNAVQVSWRATGKPEGLSIAVRFSAKVGPWSEWNDVETSEEDVLLSRKYTQAQYRVLFTAGSGTQLENISLMFEDRRMASTRSIVGAGSLHSASKRKSNTKDLSKSAASRETGADALKPVMVSRVDWGARAATASGTAHVPNKMTIHHTWIPTKDQYKGSATIRGIQNYHMDTNGWNDIGYHFLIGPNGTIYQGRDEDVLGSHAVPNTGNIGICLVGDFDQGNDVLEGPQKEALTQLLAYLSVKYSLPPADNDDKRIYGHHDFSTKTCPGTTVYEDLPAIRLLTAARITEGAWLKKNPILLVNAYERGADGHSRLSALRTALDNKGRTFDEATASQVRLGIVPLSEYRVVLWVLVNESTNNSTFDGTEQNLLRAYLEQGGNLLVTGTEIGWDLDHKNNGRSFYRDYLKAMYKKDGSGSGMLTAVPGSLFAGIANLSFPLASPYAYPDAIETHGGSYTVLRYGDGATSTAGIAYEGTFGASTSIGRVLNFGFALESISNSAALGELLDKSLVFFGEGTEISKPIVINEVLANAGNRDWDGSGRATFTDEWIELYNPNDQAADISGYSLDDKPNGGSSAYRLRAGTVIPARGIAVFYRKQTGLALNNRGDSVSLYNPKGERVDFVSWTRSKKDRSIYRLSNGGSWSARRDATPTPGGPNK